MFEQAPYLSSRWWLEFLQALGILVVLFLTASPIAIAQSQADNGDTTKILALENVWNLATVHKDIKALDELLADSFVGTDWDSTFMNKSQFIHAIDDENYHPQQMMNETATVHLHSNSAVVTGIYREKGVNSGKPYDHRARFTDIWMFENGEWRCVASHSSLITATKQKY